MGMDYSEVGAVCSDCAKAAGFTPKDKAVGVWMDECGICHERKPCTDLWHDWKKKPNPTMDGRVEARLAKCVKEALI